MVGMKKSSVHDTTAPTIFARPVQEETPQTAATCDRVRDLMKDDPEFAGKVLLTCDKPLDHDKRGGHRMRNEHGKTTCTWTGPADND